MGRSRAEIMIFFYLFKFKKKNLLFSSILVTDRKGRLFKEGKERGILRNMEILKENWTKIEVNKT